MVCGWLGFGVAGLGFERLPQGAQVQRAETVSVTSSATDGFEFFPRPTLHLHMPSLLKLGKKRMLPGRQIDNLVLLLKLFTPYSIKRRFPHQVTDFLQQKRKRNRRDEEEEEEKEGEGGGRGRGERRRRSKRNASWQMEGGRCQSSSTLCRAQALASTNSFEISLNI